MGHTEINAWGNHVRHPFFGGGAVIIEPRISILFRYGECQVIALIK